MLSKIWLESRLLCLSFSITTYECTRCVVGTLCENMTSSTKPKVHIKMLPEQDRATIIGYMCKKIWWSSAMWFSHYVSTHTHLFYGPLDFVQDYLGEPEPKSKNQICISLQTDTTPVPHHSVFYRPDALPATQLTVSKHWRRQTDRQTDRHTHHSTSHPSREAIIRGTARDISLGRGNSSILKIPHTFHYNLCNKTPQSWGRGLPLLQYFITEFVKISLVILFWLGVCHPWIPPWANYARLK